MASLYSALPAVGEADRHISAATIEPHLEQIGQRDPVIEGNLRHYEGREHKFDRIVNLSLTDARELALALNYLVDLAE